MHNITKKGYVISNDIDEPVIRDYDNKNKRVITSGRDQTSSKGRPYSVNEQPFLERVRGTALLDLKVQGCSVKGAVYTLSESAYQSLLRKDLCSILPDDLYDAIFLGTPINKTFHETDYVNPKTSTVITVNTKISEIIKINKVSAEISDFEYSKKFLGLTDSQLVECGSGSSRGGDREIPDFPGWDPNRSPGEGYEWRGRGEPGSGQGNWYNPSTGESLYPHLDHAPPIPPHWDYNYRGSETDGWRIFPDGTWEPKCYEWSEW